MANCCWSPWAAVLSAGLGYEEQGVSVERGFVTVDICRTSAEGVSRSATL